MPDGPAGDPADADFDELALAAATAAGMPTALVTLARGERLWFRGRAGFDLRFAPRRGSFGEQVIEGKELEIHDARLDPRFAGHRLVAGEPHLRFYAGFPLQLPTGETVGSLSVIDYQPSQLDESKRMLLRVLARQVVAQLELRRQQALAAEVDQHLSRVEARYHQLAVRQFAEAQALAQIGSWEWDITTGRVTWSPQMFRIFGMTDTAKRGDGVSPDAMHTLIHPEDRGRAFAFSRGMLKQGGRDHLQVRTLGVDGSERHVDGWVELEQDPVTHRSLRAWGTLQDVTDRVHRDAALAESEQRLRLTIETSPVGFALIGLDGRWLQVNAAMARIVGYSRARLMELRFQDITHPDDVEADLVLFADLAAGRRDSYRLDKRYVHSSGREVWVSLTASLVRRADGQPLHYVAQVEDIGERRRATAELQAERDFSGALLAAMHDGYVYLEQGTIVVVNDVFCQLTGLSKEALVGTSAPFPFWAPEDAEKGAALLRQVINDKTGQVDLPITRADGTRFEASVQLQPVRRPGGRVRGYVALIRDITDRNQQERRLRHQADHDGLTGLLNRAAFHVRLTERVASAHASGAQLSIAVLDLDRFKAVNDTHGHSAGDAVLAEFADRLRGHARGDDIIGRLGGEEFGWVMSDTGREEALAALGRTVDAVRRHPFPHIGRLTFSAGVAELQTFGAGPEGPLLGETALGVLQRADEVLYCAKAAGRDCVLAA